MFSGIVETIGTVEHITGTTTDKTFVIRSTLTGLCIGDSLAVNGVCLTVRDTTRTDVTVTASFETLALTNLGGLHESSPVNLETSLTLQKPIGGHLVQGHVAQTTRLVSMHNVGDARTCRFSIPAGLERYIVTKGYVALDGMSLTVVRQDETTLDIMFIPHTLSHTIAQHYVQGALVNIEVDIYARYLEKMYAPSQRSSGS